MVVYSPLILVSGVWSQLPPGDTIKGVSASGDSAYVLAEEALASGNAALVDAAEALASGNAALVDAESALANISGYSVAPSGAFGGTGASIVLLSDLVVQSQVNISGQGGLAVQFESDVITISGGTGAGGTFTASGLTIDGTATFAVGSSGTPAITASGDPNTGIYFPAADTIGFAEGGNEAARFDSSGRLLIGDISSAYSNVYLLVAGGDNANYMAMLNTTASDASNSRYSYFHFRGTQSGGEETSLASIGGMHEGTADDAKGHLKFFTNNGTQNNSLTEAMRLDSSQNLRFNSGYGSVATAYGVRAWARINGTGTISEYGKGGFSSITDQSTGVYRFNFTNAMPDTNYAVAGSTDTNTVFQVSSTFNTGFIDTSIQNQSGNTADSDDVSVIVVR